MSAARDLRRASSAVASWGWRLATVAEQLPRLSATDGAAELRRLAAEVRALPQRLEELAKVVDGSTRPRDQLAQVIPIVHARRWKALRKPPGRGEE
jgi:hypothetical protein